MNPGLLPGGGSRNLPDTLGTRLVQDEIMGLSDDPHLMWVAEGLAY